MPDVKGPTVVCSAFVEKKIGNKSKFLVVFCPRFKVWRVPGGRAERGETLEHALLREMKEEVGIVFRNPKFLGYGEDRQYHFKERKRISRLLMFFRVKTDKELKIDPDEAEDFKWVTLAEMRKIKNKEGALADFLEKNPDTLTH